MFHCAKYISNGCTTSVLIARANLHAVCDNGSLQSPPLRIPRNGVDNRQGVDTYSDVYETLRITFMTEKNTRHNFLQAWRCPPRYELSPPLRKSTPLQHENFLYLSFPFTDNDYFTESILVDTPICNKAKSICFYGHAWRQGYFKHRNIAEITKYPWQKSHYWKCDWYFKIVLIFMTCKETRSSYFCSFDIL